LHGIELWKRHPVTGVGPGAFGQATGSGFQAHNLYGQVLGELGTPGALALGIVVFALIANGLESRRLARHGGPDATFLRRVSTAVLVALLLLLLQGCGSHNLYRYNWLWFGAFQAAALNCLRQHLPERLQEGVLTPEPAVA